MKIFKNHLIENDINRIFSWINQPVVTIKSRERVREEEEEARGRKEGRQAIKVALFFAIFAFI